jgi:Ser/Thr protein kinase RdoA (MazF antagonist)
MAIPGAMVRSKKDARKEAEPAALLAEVWRIQAPPATWVTDKSFSGKAFARLASADGVLCLRRYPSRTSASWVGAIHAAVGYLERRDFTLFPRFLATETGETLVRHDGYLYDASNWAPGAPRSAEHLGVEHIANLGAAVARLHVAGEGAPGPIVRFDWLNGRQVLIQRLAWDAVPRGKDPWQTVDNLAAFFQPLSERDAPTQTDEDARAIVELALAALGWLARTSSVASLDGDTPTLTHGDLWSDHVRFSGTEVSALLDLDTLALRTPLGDVAALCADFGHWDAQRCQAILSGYRRHRAVARGAVAALPRLGALRTLGVLRERLRAWLDPARGTNPLAIRGGPVPYWCDRLRTLIALDVTAFGEL